MWITSALALLMLAPATGAAPLDPGAAPGGWGSPVAGSRVVSDFDPPARRWLAGHRGVDLHAAPGETVRAAGSGVVVFARVLAGRGVVVVRHGELRTTYEPVDPLVAVGSVVRTGDPLGRVGSGPGHCGDGRCLHLGLKRGRAYLNPTLLLTASTALLRPW
jgi:murein DD-endopeptidase MepM/ murein hydrolase activator NlpD